MRRRPLAWGLLVGLGVVIGILGPEPARAYVRTRSPNTCALVTWTQSCIYIQPDASLEQTDLTAAEVEQAIKSAIASWNERLLPSSYMRLRYLAPDGEREVNRLDQLQLIKFRRERWCRPGANGMTTCFDPAATAVTTVSFLNKPQDSTLDGRIVDADIDMNAFNYRFFDAAKGSIPSSNTDPRTPVDLWNTMTHELGHVLGLEHTCRLDDASYPSCVVTDRGERIPSCEDVELGRRGDPALQLIYETTMYPTSTSTEIGRRLPKADDLAGAVDSYPQGRDPLTCDTPYVVDPVGCAASRAPIGAARTSAASGAPSAASVAFALLGIAAMTRLGLRRSRRRAVW
jgi:hypothetical protein